jgi:mRNA-degrading endonuclease RelE of RelBE toxin-antitoxin system
VPSLVIHRDAADDLQSIRARGERAEHGVILAFLQQSKADPSLLETLAEDWFGEDGSADYSVQRVVSLHQRGKRIWRVKVLTLKGLATAYRVLYAFDRDQQMFYVLGIPPRDIAYDQTHPRIQRLIAVYDSLDLS